LGYDVWLGNARGSRYALGHTKYNYLSDKPLYWDFDFEEMGLYDLPANIDFILNHTG
jgi:lysosomal acid lipase/cholesteryl ester hydrolase